LLLSGWRHSFLIGDRIYSLLMLNRLTTDGSVDRHPGRGSEADGELISPAPDPIRHATGGITIDDQRTPGWDGVQTSLSDVNRRLSELERHLTGARTGAPPVDPAVYAAAEPVNGGARQPVAPPAPVAMPQPAAGPGPTDAAARFVRTPTLAPAGVPVSFDEVVLG
jgi:hypothetical protein